MKILRATINRWNELEITVDHLPSYNELTFTAYRFVEPARHKIPPHRRARLITQLEQSITHRWLKARITLGHYNADDVEKFTIYYAEHPSGYANYFLSYDHDKNGCNGHTFRLPMHDGTTAEVVGPYTSRAEIINKHVPGAKLYTGRQISASILGQSIRYPADLTVSAARAALARIPAAQRR